MENLYLKPADILIPKSNPQKWSVIACDQYTSEPEYWKSVEDFVGDAPSALNIILPEVYLQKNNSERIARINANMENYLSDGIFREYKNTVVYTRRTLADGSVRNGLVGLIDLEDYSYEKGVKSGIRATEKTVVERIPPRVEIRKDASIELPHIMLLIDDSQKQIIEKIAEKRDTLKKIYDFDLMLGSGHLEGYILSDEDVLAVNSSLQKLKKESSDGLLFAVGDGNHSLATAKECYRLGKGPRFALTEVVNIHDSSLEFEPIYRLLVGCEPQKVIEDFKNWSKTGEGQTQQFRAVYGENETVFEVPAKGTLPVATLQAFLDEYLDKYSDISIDYIHGIDSVKKLAKNENSLGFIFDGMEKSQLFEAVSKDGSLPRKTFSMGHADDKRFYFEARKIK